MGDAREQDFRCFLECLIDAGSKMKAHYFQLPVAGDEESIFRERVYCYELYHQLRNVLGDGFPYKLDGEVDKAGHPIIKEDMTPDFIVHVPGEMDRNLVVIEVKSIKVEDRISRLGKDICNLKTCLQKCKYYRAIMLIYGGGKQEELPSVVETKAKSLIGDYKDRILIVWHSGPRKKPEVVC